MKAIAIAIIVGAVGIAWWAAPSVRAEPSSAPAGAKPPATRPTPPPSANQLLDSMLQPQRPASAGGRTGSAGAAPLQPLPDPPAKGKDATTGAAAVAPGAPQLSLMREGTYIVDRIGRLTRSADGQTWEFTFESDGKALQDPPMIVLPNLKLMAMENALVSSGRDLKFHITGMVTEYKGRNYVLLEKVVQVSSEQ